MFTPHKGSEAFACNNLKPALSLPLFEHVIESQRSRYPFECRLPLIFTFKQAFNQTIGCRTDKHRIRLSVPLDASRNVGGLA